MTGSGMGHRVDAMEDIHPCSHIPGNLHDMKTDRSKKRHPIQELRQARRKTGNNCGGRNNSGWMPSPATNTGESGISTQIDRVTSLDHLNQGVTMQTYAK